MKSILKKALSLFMAITMVAAIAPNFVVIPASAAEVDEGWLWPVKGSRKVSDYFRSGHKGLDISGGTSVYAAKSGTVVDKRDLCKNSAGKKTGISCKECGKCEGPFYNDADKEVSKNEKVGWCLGNYVIIKHDEKTYTKYVHLSKVSVEKKAKVVQGDIIGEVGNYGKATGKHLHFEIGELKSVTLKNQKNTNPTPESVKLGGITGKKGDDDGRKYKFDTKCTITFNLNGGSGTTPSKQVIFLGGKATEPTTKKPTKSGFTFDGWSTKKDGAKWSFSTVIKEDVLLYARWKPNSNADKPTPTPQYSVTFNLNGASGSSDVQIVNEGDRVPKPYDPARSGYTFGGWYKEAACTNKWDFNTAVYSSITLYAKWTKDKETEITNYSVSFDYGTSVNVVAVKEGDRVSQPTDPVRSGYTFSGWYKESACINKWNFNTPIYENMTLYAKWTTTTCTIYYEYQANINGSTCSIGMTNAGNKIPKPADPVRSGYVFEGWYKESACINKWDFNTPIYENTSIYAKWAIYEAKICSVYFDCQANDSSYIGRVSMVNPGNKISKPTDPVRSGYTFGGWYEESACINKWDFNTPIYENMTLYAKWTENQPKNQPAPSSSSKWKVTSSIGLKVCKTPSTSASTVGGLGNNAVFTVSETKKADGYTWDKVKSISTKGSGDWGSIVGYWVKLDYCVEV